jgi:hypothetical protein
VAIVAFVERGENDCITKVNLTAYALGTYNPIQVLKQSEGQIIANTMPNPIMNFEY